MKQKLFKKVKVTQYIVYLPISVYGHYVMNVHLKTFDWVKASTKMSEDENFRVRRKKLTRWIEDKE